MLFVHGQPGSGTMWGPLPHFVAPFANVVTFDRPGWGEPENAAGNLASNVSYLDSIVGLFLGQSPVLLGYSYGAAVVINWMAETQPNQSRALLVAPAANQLAYGTVDRLFELELLGGIWSLLGLGLGTRFGKRAAVANLYRARSLLFESQNLLADLGKINYLLPDDARVEIIAGLLDRVVPPSAVVALAAALGGVDVFWSPRQGHMVIWKDPELIAMHLARLLRS